MWCRCDRRFQFLSHIPLRRANDGVVGAETVIQVHRGARVIGHTLAAFEGADLLCAATRVCGREQSVVMDAP